MAINLEARKRLDDAMGARRVELDQTWRDVAAAGGLSYETLRAARRGTGDIPPLTQASIERGLQWERGSVAAVLGGGTPKAAGVDERRAALISMSVDEFIARFRGAESVYLEEGDRLGPDRWLKNALTAREEAIHDHYRSLIAKSNAS